MYYLINGYWKDDLTEFTDYLVSDSEEIIENLDKDVFFYGLDEDKIKLAIENGTETNLEFVITSYSIPEFIIQ